MRILRAPLPQPIRMSFGQLDHRHMALVEVEAGGNVGYGESWINYPSWACRERKATIEEGVRPLLVGTELASVPEAMRRVATDLLPLARQWGAPGPIWQAISGVDIALWDLLGKLRDAPVAELLGGARRRRIPLYASGLGPNQVGRMCRQQLARGFRAVKVKVGFLPEVDSRNLAEAAAARTDGTALFVDVNQAWSVAEAVSMSPLLREAGVSWVEEPVVGNRLEDLHTLHRRTGMAIATGENVYGLDEFGRLARSPAIALLQPDVTKSGGITAIRSVCEVAAARSKRVAPHFYGGAVGLAATLHLAAAIPGIEVVENDVQANPLRDRLLRTPLRISDGTAELPAGPGLGIELDPVQLAGFEYP